MFRSPDKSASNPELDKTEVTNAGIFSNTIRKRKHDDSVSSALESFTVDIMSKLTSMKLELSSDIANLKHSIVDDVKKELEPVNLAITTLRTDLSTAISELNTKHDTVTMQLNSIKTSVDLNSQNHLKLESKVDVMDFDLKEIQKDVSEAAVLRDEIKELKYEIKQQQQWDRLLNLEISGLPEIKNEDLYAIVAKIALHAGVTLNKDDVINASRIQSRLQNTGKPKNVIVKLRNRITKDNILAGLRKSRGVTTLDISIPGDARRIYVSEHLTVDNKLIYKRCRDMAKSKQFQFVWTKNCKIFMRKNETSPAICIKEESDLKKLH